MHCITYFMSGTIKEFEKKKYIGILTHSSRDVTHLELHRFILQVLGFDGAEEPLCKHGARRFLLNLEGVQKWEQLQKWCGKVKNRPPGLGRGNRGHGHLSVDVHVGGRFVCKYVWQSEYPECTLRPL